MTTKLQELAAQGQSAWCDYIRRSFITSGELKALIDEGLRGVTSNPTIFDKAIAGSSDYDRDIGEAAREGKSVKQIYEALAMQDIAMAADLLRPVYDATKGEDGYVSLEANPALAHDTEGTVREVRRLFAALARPNVMIKVPATQEGIPAIETLTAEGININVTLIFSRKHYEKVAEAYISGLEKRAEKKEDLSRIASVASVFVSRLDTAADPLLEKAGAGELMGKIALANAKVIYARFLRIFATKRWKRLAARGARVQRVLWGSTGTKNPLYSDTLYVDNLIGPGTVNTIPPATLDAWRDHGQAAKTVGKGLRQARENLSRLPGLGIDLDGMTQKLQDDGVAAFKKSFDDLLVSIAEKKKRLAADRRFQSSFPAADRARVDAALNEAVEQKVVPRLWNRDHTLWKPEPTEISNRLGWLHIAEEMARRTGELKAFAEEIRREGYNRVLLLGMGGSSLAPEVLGKTFGVKEGFPDLAVLDSTDPGAVLARADLLDPGRTLFIVSTKSGTTAETHAFFKYFFSRQIGALALEGAGRHFIAVTDPDSPLEARAKELGFRRVFLNDPEIGGRYSALSYVGLVPAALIGVDIDVLLDRAVAAMRDLEPSYGFLDADNAGARLGAAMGELARAGRDKLTLAASPDMASFGDWVEQLIAESTGKEGQGIVPVVGEPLGPPEVYGEDRLFVALSLAGEDSNEPALQALEAAGHPVIRLLLSDLCDLGGQFFLWEFATAIAGWRLRINPFDQPNVEAAKVLARRMLSEYLEKGSLPPETPAVEDAEMAVYGNAAAGSPEQAFRDFLDSARPGDYIALQAYLHPSEWMDELLLRLRTVLRDKYRKATTSGYGPRFLHSTGQLHKGGAGRGLFIQLTAEDARDAAVPGDDFSPSTVTFGVMKAAQAMGDRRALEAAGRRVIRIHFGFDVTGGIRRLTGALEP